MTDNGSTLIDVWELPEERIDESVARWRERVGLIRTAPGFRDARLHRRLSPESPFGLVNVAHWDSVEARDEALAHPAFTASAATTSGYATVYGGWYDVAAEFTAPGDGSGAGPEVTFVNAFELPGERVDAFLPLWRDHAEPLTRAPGFRDGRLHRAVAPDARFPLVLVAHWDDVDSWRAADDDARRRGFPPLPDRAAAHPALFGTAAAF
ncbi:Antibiotic biosynthesis monooxygenase [Streptomyces zhaozhouensis]|uniref:Antibiotic biosynthesis monooxygenase n=1 Tax=Streptomyces zhaozhouensis TaxID=1300267 RepID=A0A286DXB5_9ACTN|nr:antibiotic biosynthesis monooxygenase [Streptomyces zhaozhouensis]SOD63317.1 Antibiotic biosynthesis monooxygenase [Streptomyces zhaozhouensis]